MRFRRIKDEEQTVGLTPLIDIVFLIIIFLMVTSHFRVASGVPIRLPKVTQNAYEGKSQDIIVAIDREGRLYLKGEKIDLKELGPKLQDFVEKDEVVQLVLQADKDVRHGRVVQVMDLAKSAGISSIVIAANWDTKKGFVIWNQKKKIRKESSGKFPSLSSVFCGPIVAWLVFGEQGLLHLYHTELERQAYIERIRQLTEENQALVDEISRLRTDMEYVESVARKHFNMVKPNEVIYRFAKEKQGGNDAKDLPGKDQHGDNIGKSEREELHDEKIR